MYNMLLFQLEFEKTRTATGYLLVREQDDTEDNEEGTVSGNSCVQWS